MLQISRMESHPSHFAVSLNSGGYWLKLRLTQDAALSAYANRLSRTEEDPGHYASPPLCLS